MNVFERNFDLLENARNFIEESLHAVDRAKENPNKWPFAILHLIQGLELLVKHLLASHHKILVYENIDNPKNTVSLQQGLERLIALGSVNIEEKEKQTIAGAIKFRNNIVHYEYKLNERQAESIYCELFEFVHFFYRKHTNSDLQEIINEDLWYVEAELLSKFKKRFIIYYGEEMDREHPLDILGAQFYNGYKIGGEVFRKILFGNETTFKMGSRDICADCGVKRGMYHTHGCDNEQCPKCGWQSLGCGCDIEDIVEAE